MNKNKSDRFLLLTGYCNNIRKLTDEKILSSIMINLPKIINTKVVKEPIITTMYNEPGLEGYIVMDTSNITISTYTLTQKLVAAIHSCKNFKYEKVIDYLKENFELNNIKFLYCLESDFINLHDKKQSE